MRIATFNAGLLDIRLAGRTLFEFTPHTRQRVKIVAECLRLLASELDLLCIQEVYHAADQQLIASVTRKSLPFQFWPDVLPALRLNSGLMLLSRFKLITADHNYFQRQSLDEFIFSKRGYIVSDICLSPYKVIRIVNTHLSSGGLLTHPESVRANRLRTNQIGEIALLEPVADILVGDLNCGPEAAPDNFQQIIRLGYIDLASSVSDGHRSPFYTWDPSNQLNMASLHSSSPPQRIDHILARLQSIEPGQRRSVARVLDEPFPLLDGITATPSDHYGVKVDLALNYAT